jgi:RNA polymerase-binding transcription factor DksA
MAQSAKRSTKRSTPAKKATPARKVTKRSARKPAKKPARAAAKKPAKKPAKAAAKKPAKAPAKKPAKAAAKKPAKKPAPSPAKAPAKAPAKKASKKAAAPRRSGPPLAKTTVEKLERLLVEERGRLLRQATELQAEAEALATEREPGDTQFDEESGEGDTINIERERDLLLSASAQQIVDDIDRALERIANGTYGLCVPAGRRINLERLEALPYAETCVDCKARAERRR